MYSKNNCEKIMYQAIVDNKFLVEFNTKKKRSLFLKKVGSRVVTSISNVVYPWNPDDGEHNLKSPADFAKDFGYDLSKVKQAIRNGKIRCETVGSEKYLVEKDRFYQINGVYHHLIAKEEKTMYVKYTEEQKQTARNADLLEYLRRRGYTVVPHGSREFMIKEHDSIKISNNLWCRFSRQEVNTESGEVSYEGGNTLDFAMKIEGLSFPDAMKAINGEMNYGLTQYHYDYESADKNPLKEKTVNLPDSNGECRHVFAYLCKTRCIDEEIVRHMVKDKLLYESKEHHNCVFVSRDEDGTARYAFIRGTNSEKKFAKEAGGSTKAYGLTMKGTGDTVYVFEAIIDAMSHATFTKLSGGDWRRDFRVSLGGVSPLALNHLLSTNSGIKNVVICTDNDEPGIEASRNIMKSLEGKGYNVSTERSKRKDWNEDLQFHMHRQRSMARAS